MSSYRCPSPWSEDSSKNRAEFPTPDPHANKLTCDTLKAQDNVYGTTGVLNHTNDSRRHVMVRPRVRVHVDYDVVASWQCGTLHELI
jgi:hypothetical protein